VNYKDYFKDKKIAVIGLGPHGEMMTDIKFLLKNKALLSLYDMRSENRLRKHIMNLSVGGLRRYSFGKINSEDLLDSDLIILSSEISKKSTFLKKAINSGIQIDYPDTLFLKIAPPVTLVGIIGAYGKSTVTQLLFTLFKKAFSEYENQGLFLIDHDSIFGVLSHLKKVKKDDVVLARIPENLMEYYYQIHMSPHVAIITSVVSFKILEFQTYNNFIVAPDYVVDVMKEQNSVIFKAKILRTRASSIPVDWNLNIKGLHNMENISLVLQASELFKIPKDLVREVAQSFVGLKGRIEFIKKIQGVEFYNDSASINPDSTLTAMRTLSDSGKLILILGGAYTGCDYGELLSSISQYVSTLIILPGSGTIGLREALQGLKGVNLIHALTLEQAVISAKNNAKKGDKVLFSPGFEAVGVDISRKDRGERFVHAVREL
jgi:UDP-N-acetylmuramoylalanine--D-glutamate ligase